jgi:transcriptional regulator with XRE-family HTH domain
LSAGEKAMNQNPKPFIDRIRNIRKAKKRSIHDCATLLDISKEHYLRFENGSAPLSLPDIELLAWFFDVPLRVFIDDSPIEDYKLSIPELSLRPKYNQLRHKMIQAQFNVLKQKTGITLGELHEKTGIPQEALADFANGSAPIPISNLVLIANGLGESLDYFFSNGHQMDDPQPEQAEQKSPKWQPEYPESEEAQNDQKTGPYEQLMSALKHISNDDRAQIAKILLQRLKSLQ